MPTIEKVKEVIRDSLGLPELEIMPDAKLEDDLHFDSLDIVEFCMDLEIKFDLTFNALYDDKWASTKTVQDVVDLIDEVLAK